jgi:hypothetical protein
MAKKLKSFVDDRLYELVTGMPGQYEDYYVGVLREWLNYCEVRSINPIDAAAFEYVAYRVKDRKRFEKEMLKEGYDVYDIMHSIYERHVTACLEKKLKDSLEVSEKLKKQLDEAAKNGVVIPEFAQKQKLLEQENTSLRAALNSQKAELDSLRNGLHKTGGIKMPDNNITQWEYKQIDVSKADTYKTALQEMNELGEQGWEQSGVLSINGYSDKIILKRPKQNNNRQMKNDYDPIYSR